jgi:isopenicillin-N epimerase
VLRGRAKPDPSIHGYGYLVTLDEPVSSPSDWALDPAIVHLNHGSYGGCPRAVIDAATAWRTRLEAAPMRFLVLEWQRELDRARAALAAFVRAPDSRLVFVPNATTGVAIALASMPLAPGDAILTTDHCYRACKNQLDRTGAPLVIVPIALPFDADQFVDGVARALAPHVKLALLDHVTSPTALRLPIERVIPLLAARGIASLIDGAHAPGQLELDLGALDATWYAGNCHKWVCAPKGTGFLVAPAGVVARPVVTSHGASPAYGPANRLHAELDWSGTYDPTPHLTVPAAIATVASLGGGWPAVIARDHALVIEMRRRFVEALGGAPMIAPESALGAMAAIPIALPGIAPFALEQQLLIEGWEVPIVDWPTGPLVRLSAHLYNHAGEAEALAARLRDLGVTLR